jgi:hypothetical protein
MKSAVFWDVALCGSCLNRSFGGTYRLSLQPPAQADSSLTDSSTLKMEAIRSSETSASFKCTKIFLGEFLCLRLDENQHLRDLICLLGHGWSWWWRQRSAKRWLLTQHWHGLSPKKVLVQINMSIIVDIALHSEFSNYFVWKNSKIIDSLQSNIGVYRQRYEYFRKCVTLNSIVFK